MSQYSNGLCGCCSDCASCCCVLWCFPCIAGKAKGAAAKSGFDTMLCVISCCIPFVGEYMLRSSVQQAYGIQEGCCTTCCYVCFCTCCAAIQDVREVKTRGDYR